MGEIISSDASEPKGEVVSDEKVLDAFDPNYVGPQKLVEQEYSIAQEADPQRRLGGVYLDEVERRNAEVVRAKIENREPDLENPPSIAGTPVVPTAVLKSRYPGDYEIPVAGTQTVSVGTNNPEGLTPEDRRKYDAAKKKAAKK